jgi:hypothetical protein
VLFDGLGVLFKFDPLFFPAKLPPTIWALEVSQWSPIITVVVKNEISNFNWRARVTLMQGPNRHSVQGNNLHEQHSTEIRWAKN